VALRLLTEYARVRPIDGSKLVFPSPTGKACDYIAAFNAAVAAAGIQNFRCHDLRHSAATYLALEGATEAQLRAVGGWKSSEVRKYLDIGAQDAKDVLARMNRKILGGD
jgi:integrase